MADVALLHSEFRVLNATAIISTVQVSAPVAFGSLLKLNGSVYDLADATSAANAAATRMALTEADGSGFAVVVQPGAFVRLGATAAMVKGERYYISPNAGKFMPSGDLLAANFRTLLGTCENANGDIRLVFEASGVDGT